MRSFMLTLLLSASALAALAGAAHASSYVTTSGVVVDPIQYNPGVGVGDCLPCSDTNLGPGANLSSVFLNGSDLTGADLTNTNLLLASFFRAWLIGADLTGATATATNFERANLTSANLTGANLSPVAARIGQMAAFSPTGLNPPPTGLNPPQPLLYLTACLVPDAKRGFELPIRGRTWWAKQLSGR